MKAFWTAASRPRIVLTGLKVAFVVGTILNVINQAQHIADGDGVSWPHLILNYVVPFCVSVYSAARNDMARRHDP
ncbi:MAG: hypothetical protein D6782_05335 [Alphaproteobacteria bacterium]|nr:MAG: hypothetical protein D6782_05335 [Alphaproteobacteria bacterium]